MTADKLRRAWLSKAPVRVDLRRCELSLVEGLVEHVAPSGAFAVVAGVHVPLERVAKVKVLSR